MVLYAESNFSNSSPQTRGKTPEKQETILLLLSSCSAKRYNYSSGKLNVLELEISKDKFSHYSSSSPSWPDSIIKTKSKQKTIVCLKEMFFFPDKISRNFILRMSRGNSSLLVTQDRIIGFETYCDCLELNPRVMETVT